MSDMDDAQKPRRRFSYADVMSTLAVFLVIAGGTALAAALPKDSVKSATVKDEALKTKDLKDGKAVGGADVIDESLSGSDLAGNSLSGADIDEASLGQVPAALLGGFGRTGAMGSCNPDTGGTYATCASVTLNLPRPTRVLLIGRITAFGNSDGGRGRCVLVTVPGGVVPNTTVTPLVVDDAASEDVPVAGVTDVLPAGSTLFALDCNQEEGPTQFAYTEATVTAVAISPD